MDSFPRNFKIICDGGSLGNNVAGGGDGYGSFVIIPDICEQRFIQHFGPKVTNNEAEYMIAAAALSYLKSAIEVRFGRQFIKEAIVVIHTDSQLVVGHMTRNWKVKAANLIPHVSRLSALIHEFASVSFQQEQRKFIYAALGH